MGAVDFETSLHFFQDVLSSKRDIGRLLWFPSGDTILVLYFPQICQVERDVEVLREIPAELCAKGFLFLVLDGLLGRHGAVVGEFGR